MSGQKRRSSKGRKMLPNGRNKEDGKYVRFFRWMMDSQAFLSLDSFEVRLLLELYSLYNGANNGYLFLSIREASRRCNMSKDKAGKSFKVLQDKGFIRRRADEPINFILREARCWILTEFDFGPVPASKEFMKWCSKKEK